MHKNNNTSEDSRNPQTDNTSAAHPNPLARFVVANDTTLERDDEPEDEQTGIYSSQLAPRAPDMADARIAAAVYAAAGLRIAPVHPKGTTDGNGISIDKKPRVGGFGRDNPHATWPPATFRANDGVAILPGPCPAAGADRRLLGLDLDKAMDRAALERLLGCALPETLTSKGWRHAYYWIAADSPLYQRNRLLTVDGGALDIRPNAGGYLIERNEWDREFDVALVATLPEAAHAALAAALGESCRKDANEREPLAVVASDEQDSSRDTELVRHLAEVWQPDTTGDEAFGGLGGWLERRGVSAGRQEYIADALARATRSTHPDAVERVLQAHNGKHTLGLPTLKRALLANGAGLPGSGIESIDVRVQDALNAVEDIIRETTGAPIPAAQVAAKARHEAATADIVREPIEDEEEDERTERLRKLLGGRVYTARAMCSIVLPPIEWLDERLGIACGAAPACVVGEAGIGKSTLVQELALAVAMPGATFLGRTLKNGPVLHIDLEQGSEAIRRYKALGLDGTAELDVNAFPDLRLSDKDAIARIREVIETGAAGGKPYRLVVIDSLKASLPGVDENASEIRNFIDPLTPICERTGASMLFVHHARKHVDGQSGLAASRGSTAISDAVSTSLLMRRGSGGEVKLTVEKLRSSTPRAEGSLVQGQEFILRMGLDQKLEITTDRADDIEAAVRHLATNLTKGEVCELVRNNRKAAGLAGWRDADVWDAYCRVNGKTEPKRGRRGGAR